MAKRRGYYSPDAIIARAEALAYQNQKAEAEQAQPQAAQPVVSTQTQVKPIDVTSVFTPSPDGTNWNYKNATTDMQGRPLEARNFMGRVIKPKSFDPNGNPYFGEGVSAWLKKWAYKISEESATKGEAQQSWQKFAETSSKFSANFLGSVDQNDQEAKTQKAREQGSLFLQGAAELWDASTKFLESQDAEIDERGFTTGGFKTPITYALRAVNAAVGMTLEAFQFASEVPEKIGGVQRSMREFATEKGSVLPELTFDPVDQEYYDRVKSDPKLASMYAPDNGFKANQEAADFVSRLMLPALATYDYVRFLTSPGSAEEKKQAVQNGWTEGRMLYTEILKDSVRAEYQSRVKAGEDPGLLVMELEDPWIEAGGEMLLDPLNALGLLGKAKKAGDTLLEASRVVEHSGLLTKPDFIEGVKNIGKLSNDGEAAVEMKKVAGMIAEESSYQARRLASAQEYKATSYIPSANKIIHRKTIGNHISAITQAIRNAGGTPDDVMDYVNALRKFATGDATQIMDGMATIAKMPVQSLAYNDAAFEVGYMLNNILSEGDIVKDMQKLGGNFQDLSQWFDKKITKAMDFAFPSIKEMERADLKIKELSRLGEAADANTQRLAEAFKTLQKEHPGYVKWAQFQDLAEQSLKGINGFLANNYFSLSYGYAFRNLTQNMVTLWVDGGLMFSKEGALKFAAEGVSTPGLDNIILKMHSGQMPEMFKMGKTQIAEMTEGSLGKRIFEKLNSWGYSPAQLGQAAEIYAGKMIYVKKYRETMDAVATFGGMFPELSKWQEVGYSAEQAQDFIDMFRANVYDEAATLEAFSRKYGDGSVDKWRMLDWVNPEAKKGLQEYGSYWDEIHQFVNKAGNPTQREVLDFIDSLKQRAKKDALKAVDEPARLADTDPVAKLVMDDAAKAGRYNNPDIDNAFLAQKIQAERALDEFTAALDEVKIGASQTDPEAVRRINQEIQSINPLKEQTIAKHDELQRFVIDLRNKANSGMNPADIWDEAIMGPKPKSGIITKDAFLKHLWENTYYPKRAQLWNDFFTEKLSKLQEVAKGYPELSTIFEKANYENIKLQQYADYIYSDGKIFTKPPIMKPSTVGDVANAGNVRSLANAYGQIAPAKSGFQSDNHILSIINKYSGGQYARLEEVPLDIAERALAEHAGYPVKHFVKKIDANTFDSNNMLEGLPVIPPRDPKVSPAGHVYTETKDGLLKALEHVKQGIRDRWGFKVAVNPEAEGIARLIPDLSDRAAVARSKSQIVAQKYRDFALLPYGEKTNMDFAMSLVYPYQFWYSRSYKNWMQRAFMTNPEIISRYANLKEAMANEQKDLPDWWKSQLNVSKLLGQDTENPIYINLEATLFPLYGLTGTDFNDPKKRVGWWTSVLDDMGKFGPSIWAPLQIATAAALYAQGEKETAARWGGRLIPQTATIKAVSSYFGKPLELDPSVLIFNGGMDVYEEGRVSRALSAMADEGVPEELLIEAARTHSGELWDEAYRRAVNNRAPGQISSFFFGVGFKARSESDMQIDRFYADYERMKNLHSAGYMTNDQYRQAFNDMRESYPFMDVILLSRRAGDGREAAYAYNVLSRIPPGQSSAIFEAADVDPETAAKFYDSGGQYFKNMTETERQHFYASMVDIGAMLAIPSNTTREEWTAVRARYNEIQNLQKQQFGEDVLDRISDFFALKTREERDAFEKANPEVMQAMSFKDEMLSQDPLMLRYYGGIDTIERYYTSQMYDKLEATYSEETMAKVELYYDMTSNEKAKFKKQNPDVANYFKDKYAMQDEILRELAKFGEILPATPQLQEGVEPAYAKQEDIANAAMPAPQVSYEEWANIMGDPTMQLIEDFKYGNESLPYEVRQKLTRMADDMGYEDENALLVSIMSTMP